MDYVVTAKTTPVTFAPSSLAEEVVQNVRTILATRIGDVPLQRGLGVSWEHIDKPLPAAKMLLMGEVADALRKWEPRAAVRSVEFPGGELEAMDGILPCRVTISIDEALEVQQSASSGGYGTAQTLEAPSEDPLEVARQARQIASRAATAASRSLSGLHELETTDYPAIYETGEEN